MDLLLYLIYFAFGCFFLFLLIYGAVKLAMKEVLHEFKKDIIKEINHNNFMDKSKQ